MNTPYPFPTIGARFRNIFTGNACKVLKSEPTRVQVLNHETGEREWIADSDFGAKYRPIAHQEVKP